MKKFTVLLATIMLAVMGFGQIKPSQDLKKEHSAYIRLKSDFLKKEVRNQNEKKPDLVQLMRKRDFSRLIQARYLSHFEGQFDTMYRVSYFYEGFNHLPNHSIEEIYVGTGYLPSNRVYYYFDEQERDTMWVTQFWQERRDFENSMREIWRYDHMDNLHLYILEFWEVSNAQWFTQHASRSSYEYDSTGKILSITFGEYYNGEWYPYGRVLNQYDDQGRHVATIGQDWEPIDGKWVNSWLDQYQLNAQNEWEVVKYYFWDDFNQEWMLESKATDITWLNFSEFKWLTVTLMNWDGQAWENDLKGFRTYNPSELLLSSTFQIWDGTNWLNDSRERYTYDQYDFTTEEIMEYWEDNTWVIAYGQRFTPEYDAYANPVSILTEYYDMETSLWFINMKILLDWEMVTGLLHTKPLEISIYPNPTQSQIFIKTSGEALVDSEYAIFDLSRRLLSNSKLSSNSIDVSNLPAGTYILLLRSASGKNIVQKFVKH